ncbi:hypothetical protein HRI_001642700 [Hibiscus trionum]|uniref:Uncharacterized protein n=1 Tax=Hibiscus trionum TaxID=183268 RepID=A0A9W7HLR7_HIBTR|nr:hypothetical protein HRI_001642700 [Hibiscus trionum]
MEVLRSREVVGLSVLRQRKVRARLYEEHEFDADDTSDVDDELEHEHESKSLQKGMGMGKCASLPSFASIVPPEEDEVGTVFRRILSAGALESRNPLPTASELVSALKGSREKRGITLKKQSVTWASDVYDPPPTSLMRMISIKKQQNLKRSNNTDKRKNGKKVLKVNKTGGKDMKKVRRNSGSSYKWCKQLVAELCEIECCFCRFDAKSSSNVRPVGI